MKTLKQQLQEIGHLDIIDTGNALEAFKEWLEQKYQDLGQFEYDGILNRSEKNLIESWIRQELFEELNNE